MDSSLALIKTTKDFDRKTGGVSLANLQVSKNPILLRTKVLKYPEKARFDLYLTFFYITKNSSGNILLLLL